MEDTRQTFNDYLYGGDKHTETNIREIFDRVCKYWVLGTHNPYIAYDKSGWLCFNFCGTFNFQSIKEDFSDYHTSPVACYRWEHGRKLVIRLDCFSLSREFRVILDEYNNSSNLFNKFYEELEESLQEFWLQNPAVQTIDAEKARLAEESQAEIEKITKAYNIKQELLSNKRGELTSSHEESFKINKNFDSVFNDTEGFRKHLETMFNMKLLSGGVVIFNDYSEDEI